MEFVVDANIILAAVLSDGITRELLLYKTPAPIKLYSPPFLLSEIKKYKRFLSKRTGRSESELIESVLNLLTASNVEIINMDEMKLYFDEGFSISPDLNDAMYFAAALSKRCGIWSNDSRLKNQSRIKVINTADMLKII